MFDQLAYRIHRQDALIRKKSSFWFPTILIARLHRIRDHVQACLVPSIFHHGQVGETRVILCELIGGTRFFFRRSKFRRDNKIYVMSVSEVMQGQILAEIRNHGGLSTITITHQQLNYLPRQIFVTSIRRGVICRAKYLRGKESVRASWTARITGEHRVHDRESQTSGPRGGRP